MDFVQLIVLLADHKNILFPLGCVGTSDHVRQSLLSKKRRYWRGYMPERERERERGEKERERERGGRGRERG